jgi:hypothetical protein
VTKGAALTEAMAQLGSPRVLGVVLNDVKAAAAPAPAAPPRAVGSEGPG